MKGGERLEATGIVRRIDDLGRVVIPKEIRKSLQINEGDPLEMFITDKGVLIKRYREVKEINFEWAIGYLEHEIRGKEKSLSTSNRPEILREHIYELEAELAQLKAK